jgi:hypothetical protein
MAPMRASASGSPGRVVVGIQVRVQGVGLEHHRHVPPGRRQIVHDPPADADAAPAQRLQAGDQPQQGALPAAAGPEHDHHLAVGDPEAQVGDRRRAVGVHPGDVVEQNLGHAGTTIAAGLPS